MTDLSKIESHFSLIKNEVCAAYIRCNHCGSFFIDEKQCEGCGHRTDLHPLGEILGAKSFFSITDDYYQNNKKRGTFSIFIKKANHQQELASYLRKINYRFTDIVGHFLEFNADSAKHVEDWILKYELEHIIHELIIYNISGEVLLEQYTDDKALDYHFRNYLNLCISDALTDKESLSKKMPAFIERNKIYIVSLIKLVALGSLTLVILRYL